MRIKGWWIVAFFASVLCRTAFAQTGVAAVEQSQAGQDIVGIEQVDSLKDPSFRDILARNGFVVVPMYCHQIFTPYISTPLPVFVTTDSVHRTFHILFEEQVKRMEEQLSDDVRGLTATLRQALQPAQGAALTPEQARARLQALAYLCVAAKLFDEAFAPPEEVRAIVDAEVKQISAAQGVAASSVFPEYPLGLDFTQFKPRGFYTESEKLSRFFRVMSWYGNCPFRLCSENETATARQIVAAMLRNPETLKTWERIDRIYTDLLGLTDDLTPAEYAAIEPDFKAGALKLRDPKINSMPLTPDQMPRWKELTKGMRLFGKRYVPDSEIFIPLALKYIGPSGLYMMAANGSARAEKILGAGAPPEDLAAARRTLAELKQAKGRSQYVDFLLLTETLWSPPAGNAPPFMKTEAYADKNLMTALAAWASMRHAWQLQAKLSETSLGMVEPPPPGYVEPNLPFFDRMLQLTDRTIEIFKPFPGADIARLTRFRALAAQLRAIAEKELAGKALTEENNFLLRFYGRLIAGLSYFEGNIWENDERLPWMSLVADIHTDLDTRRTALEVATGGAMPIYVVVPQNGKQYLMEGGIYSYYEFEQPMGDRLTDEAWRAKWDAGQPPALPAWTASFILKPDIESVLKRLGAGERVDEIQYMDDARIKPLLWKELQPSGKFDEGNKREWAIQMYALKAGHEATPYLIWLLAAGKPSNSNGSEDRRTAMHILRHSIRAEDVLALRDTALAGDDDQAQKSVTILWLNANLPGSEQALIEIYRKSASPDSRLFAARSLIWARSKSSVEILKDFWAAGDSEPRSLMLRAFCEALNPNAGAFGEWMSAYCGSMSVEDEKECRRQVKVLLLNALRNGGKEAGVVSLREQAIEEIAQLEMDEAIPDLEKAAEESGLAGHVADALGTMKSEHADEALTRMAQTPPKDPNDSVNILRALEERKYTPSASVVIALLDDKRPTNFYNRRVCECAESALAAFYPEGPGYVDLDGLDATSADLLVAAWKDYVLITGRMNKPKPDPAAESRFAENLLGFVEVSEKLNNEKLTTALSARRVRLAQFYIPGEMDARASNLRAKAADLLRQVTKREIAEIVKAFGEAHGVLVPSGQWLGVTLFLDSEGEADVKSLFSMDKDRRLCDPWGHPYRFLQPAVHSKAACELYSFGPNGRDENGDGDDIASWK